MSPRARRLWCLAWLGLACGAAAAQQVAYSNLGPGDSFDEEQGYSVATFEGDWYGLFCSFPVERSGTLRTVELALEHLSGQNSYSVGFGYFQHVVAAAEVPGELVTIHVADEGIELVEGERFGFVINNFGWCDAPGGPAKAAWRINGQGVYTDGPFGESTWNFCYHWFDDCECGAGFIGLEPAIRLTVLPPCGADCDGSGVLSLFDYLCFANMFNAADPSADCDADGAFLLFDFLCFVNAFNEGC